jgi:MFS family permease
VFLRELVFFILCTGVVDSPNHRQLLLLAAPIIDGLLGGYNTLQATVNSYVSDCTSDGSRANIFARFHGVFFIGIAIGPEIGALLIRSTGGVTTVFLTSTSLFALSFLLALFVLPESLTKAKREELQMTRQSRLVSDDRRAGHGLLSYPMSLILPLRVFLPRKRPDSKYKDWSFTFLAGALFCSFFSMVCVLLCPCLACADGAGVRECIALNTCMLIMFIRGMQRR